MKIINKRNFISIVCTIFTVLVIFKIVIEAVFLHTFGSIQENILVMLMLSALATFVLSQYYRLQNLPLVLVIVLQYLLLISFVLIFTWITGFFEELSPHAYIDMFHSFTIPYIVCTIIYYLRLFKEIKKANQKLETLKEGKKNEER